MGRRCDCTGATASHTPYGAGDATRTPADLLRCTRATRSVSAAARIPFLDFHLCTDSETHQVFANGERPLIRFSCLFLNVICPKRYLLVCAQQNEMCIRRHLRICQ